MKKISLLRSVFVFSGLDDGILSTIAGLMNEVRLSPHTEIFIEGKPADSFYIIEEGEVAIVKRLGPGQEKVLSVLGPGNVFGEMAFFSDSPRTAHAVARTALTAWKVERGDFMRVISEKPEAGLTILSGLLQVSMDRLEQTSRELATVYQTGKIISSTTSVRDVTGAIADELRLAIPEASGHAIYLYNEFNNEFDPAVAPAGAPEIPEGHPVIAQIRGNLSGLTCNDPAEPSFPGTVFDPAAKSAMLIPMVKNDNLCGFISLWNTANAGSFKPGHLVLVATVAAQLTEAIDNLRFRQEENDRRRLNNAKQSY